MKKILAKEKTKIILEVYPENLSQTGQSTDDIQNLLEKFRYDIYLIKPNGLKRLEKILPRREHYLLIKKGDNILC